MTDFRKKYRAVLHKKLWLGIGILIILSPLGIILPRILKSGSAWGEWSEKELEQAAGFMPEGLKRLSETWKAPIPDYAFSGWEGLFKGSIAYMISGMAGVGVVVLIAILVGRLLARKDGNP